MMMMLLLMWVVLMWRFWSQGFAIIFDCCCYWRGASWCVLFGDGDALLRGGKMIFFACVGAREKCFFFVWLWKWFIPMSERDMRKTDYYPIWTQNFSPPSVFQLRCQLQLRFFNAVRQQSKVDPNQKSSQPSLSHTPQSHIHPSSNKQTNNELSTTTATIIHNTVITISKHKQHTIIFIIIYHRQQHE